MTSLPSEIIDLISTPLAAEDLHAFSQTCKQLRSSVLRSLITREPDLSRTIMRRIDVNQLQYLALSPKTLLCWIEKFLPMKVLDLESRVNKLLELLLGLSKDSFFIMYSPGAHKEFCDDELLRSLAVEACQFADWNSVPKSCFRSLVENVRPRLSQREIFLRLAELAAKYSPTLLENLWKATEELRKRRGIKYELRVWGKAMRLAIRFEPESIKKLYYLAESENIRLSAIERQIRSESRDPDFWKLDD